VGGGEWGGGNKPKNKGKPNPLKLLAYSDAEGEAFLSCTVAADETWGHHFEPQMKRQFMEWNHSQFPYKKKN
jgi:hypothetical protein